MMSERKTLKVKSVATPKTIGDKGLLLTKFKAEEDDTIYDFWGTALSDYIKPNTEIDVDVESSEKERDGVTYKSSKITQLYLNGEPVIKKKSTWSNRGKSSEEITSLENQTRANIIADLWKGNKLNADAEEVKMLRHWLCKLQ